MFERKTEKLAAHRVFIRRVVLYALFATAIIGISLAIGVVGYHVTEGLSWIDSLLNASMLLGGMGPVNEMHTVAGKLFASFYALFCGVVFLVAVGVLIAPAFHRFMHSFHVAPEDVSNAEKEDKHEHTAERRRR
jgi:ABC-type phosphate transport system permease subunit